MDEQEEFEFRLRREKELSAARVTPEINNQPVPQPIAGRDPLAKNLYGDPNLSAVGHAVAGVPEAALSMATAAGSSALGGLAGSGALLTGAGLNEAARQTTAVQNTLTYQPRGQAARDLLTGVEQVMSIPHKLTDPVAEKLTAAGYPGLATAVGPSPEYAATLFGLRLGSRGKVKISHAIDETGQHTVKSPNGETLALEDGNQLIVKRSDTAPGSQGRGEGVARLNKLAIDAEQKGKTLVSDVSLSPASVNQWKRFAQQHGYTLKENPASISDVTKNIVSERIDTPIFEAIRDGKVSEAVAKVNSDRVAVFAAARKKGLIVPPTAIAETLKNTAAESAAGKVNIRQTVLDRNQPKFNNMAKEDLDLPANLPLNRPLLRSVRVDYGKVKEEVRQAGRYKSDEGYLGDIIDLEKINTSVDAAYPGASPKIDAPTRQLLDSAMVDVQNASTAIDYATTLRARARNNFKAAMIAGGDAAKTNLARAQYGVANAIEELLKRHLEKSGKSELAQRFEVARVKAAKSYVVEAALRGNDVVASRLAQQIYKRNPLTGNLKLIADFADQFPEVAGRSKSGAGVSKLGFSFGVGGFLTKHPALAALPVASTLTKRHILGERYQNSLLKKETPKLTPAQKASHEAAISRRKRALAIAALAAQQRGQQQP